MFAVYRHFRARRCVRGESETLQVDILFNFARRRALDVLDRVRAS